MDGETERAVWALCGGNRYTDPGSAVYPGTAVLKQKKLDILTRLDEFGFCHVDLVFWDGNNILLEFEAVRHNRLVFERPGFDRGSVFSITLRRYFDFVPYPEVRRRAHKEREFNGQD